MTIEFRVYQNLWAGNVDADPERLPVEPQIVGTEKRHCIVRGALFAADRQTAALAHVPFVEPQVLRDLAQAGLRDLDLWTIARLERLCPGQLLTTMQRGKTDQPLHTIAKHIRAEQHAEFRKKQLEESDARAQAKKQAEAQALDEQRKLGAARSEHKRRIFAAEQRARRQPGINSKQRARLRSQLIAEVYESEKLNDGH